jgi:NAD(P)-dependent dehydrogenase (short-subunit alcohol dehydrogenase family)
VTDAGVPDVLINNAGAGRWAYLGETSYDEIDGMIATPLLAALYITRAFLPAMLGDDNVRNPTQLLRLHHHRRCSRRSDLRRRERPLKPSRPEERTATGIDNRHI